MNAKTILIVGLVLTLLIGTVSAIADPQFVTTVEKNPADWSIVDGGASGKLMYKTMPKPMFVFNAEGMEPGTEYALISYAEPWGTPVKVQGTGIADEYGVVEITGKVALDLVCNTYPTLTSNEYSGTGSKIWLVPVGDLNGASFIAWNPTSYLFETDLINKGCSVPA